MKLSQIVLLVAIILLFCTLHYTYKNDYGLFLFTSFMIVSIFYVYLYVDERIDIFENSIERHKKELIQSLGNVIGTIRTNVTNSVDKFRAGLT